MKRADSRRRKATSSDSGGALANDRLLETDMCAAICFYWMWAAILDANVLPVYLRAPSRFNPSSAILDHDIAQGRIRPTVGRLAWGMGRRIRRCGIGSGMIKQYVGRRIQATALDGPTFSAGL